MDLSTYIDKYYDATPGRAGRIGHAVWRTFPEYDIKGYLLLTGCRKVAGRYVKLLELRDLVTCGVATEAAERHSFERFLAHCRQCVENSPLDGILLENATWGVPVGYSLYQEEGCAMKAIASYIWQKE